MPFLNVRVPGTVHFYPPSSPRPTIAAQQPASAAAAGRERRLSPQREASPWNAVASATLRSDRNEYQQLVERQRYQSNVMESRLVDTQQRLQEHHSEILHVDSLLSRQTRQRDITAADTMRTLEDADRRLSDVERREAQGLVAVGELQAQHTTLTRQVDETRLAIRRAEVRGAELQRELQSIEAKVAETEAALVEQQRRMDDENSQAERIRRRLEARVADVTAEAAANHERQRKLDATLTAQQKSWLEEEESIEATAAATESMLQETKLRVQALELELAEREREASQARKLREQRQEQLLEERTREREADAERHRHEITHFKDRALRERDETLAVLRAQLEEQQLQLRRKQGDRDRQRSTVSELKDQIVQLNTTLEEKRLTAQECGNLDAELRTLEHQLQTVKDNIEELQANNVRKEDEIHRLRGSAQKLQSRLDDERRLKQLLADAARELTECEETRSQRLDALERDEHAAIQKLNDHKQTLLQVKDETERIIQASTVELDTLSRRIAHVRQSVIEKESKLSHLMNDNALKQATIGQLEEEKRKLEREQLARKASAAQAARAALVELDA